MLTAGSRYARTDFNLDTRIRKRYIPLLNQQRRLRHLTSIAARNITSKLGSVPTSAFFTLHQIPNSPAFYTSEMDEECVNPNWRSFEPSGFEDEVNTAACYVVCRVWHKLQSQEEPCCRVDWVIHFSGLVFLGEQIPKEGKKFKQNTLIFGTSEGFYGSPDCCLGWSHEYSVQESIPAEPSNVRVSYSVNTVSRIQTVQRAIKQTQASAQRTRTSIQERLLGSCTQHETLALRERLSLQAEILRQELEGQKAILDAAIQRRDKALLQLEETREVQRKQQEELFRERDILHDKRRFFCETRETYLKTSAQLVLRKKQHISDLSCIYPITKLADKSGYSICGAHLPQSEDLIGHDDTMISVALGYVTHLLLMISYFLNLPLRYPLRHFGSRSTVWNLIVEKMAEKEKEFPLFPRGKDRACFSYGVYLLNKNIAQLRHLYGLSTQDLRMTLANLYSFIDLRFNIKSDPYSSLQMSGSAMAVNAGIQPSPLQPNQNPLQVQIHSDPLQAINGSLELKNHQDMVADLTREIHSMAPGTPARSHVTPTGLSNSQQMSCSLDKGLNEIRKLQHKLYHEEKKPKEERQQTFQHQQHASFPNLAAMAETDQPSTPLQGLIAADVIRESLKMCSVDSTQNSDDELLDHQLTSNDVSFEVKEFTKDLTGSF